MHNSEVIKTFVNTDYLVPMTEANQNFSKVVRTVDENGMAVILKNNKPRYVVDWKGSTNSMPFYFLTYMFEPLHIFKSVFLTQCRSCLTYWNLTILSSYPFVCCLVLFGR